VNLTIIADIFNALARAADNTDFDEAITKWVTFLGALLEQGDVTTAELNALKDHINQMVLECREPTAEEFEVLKARSDAAHETIASWSADEPADG
jgi:hypothetical protein